MSALFNELNGATFALFSHCLVKLETNAKRSAAAAKYSSRFSGSVLSRALKEL